MAELMTSGLTGLELAKRLREDFPSVRLGEIYMAVGLAAALWAADLTKAEIENAALRKLSGEIPGDAA